MPIVPDRSRAPVLKGTSGEQSLSTSLSMISCFLLSTLLIFGTAPLLQVSLIWPFGPRTVMPCRFAIGLNATLFTPDPPVLDSSRAPDRVVRVLLHCDDVHQSSSGQLFELGLVDRFSQSGLTR